QTGVPNLMGLEHLIIVLLCAVAMALSAGLMMNESSQASMWSRQNLPKLLVTKTKHLSTPLFKGRQENESSGGSEVMDDLLSRILSSSPPTLSPLLFVLFSPNNVLTAAHCIHDGMDYVEGARKLKVGLFKLKKKWGKRRRGGRQNVGSRSRLQPVFRWTPINKIQIPQEWIHTNSSPVSVFSEYDYALLELTQPVKQKHMELGVAPSSDESPFLATTSTKTSWTDLERRTWFIVSAHVEPQEQRRVIGVFSGHQWVQVEEGKNKDYNVAVRVTPLKYAQICLWIHGDSS
uniref:Uncharacterized protein n=1 Tax=Oryzias latipes TaxID=8090 RepID=A0A3P9IJ86_ORYLA